MEIDIFPNHVAWFFINDFQCIENALLTLGVEQFTLIYHLLKSLWPGVRHEKHLQQAPSHIYYKFHGYYVVLLMMQNDVNPFDIHDTDYFNVEQFWYG